MRQPSQKRSYLSNNSTILDNRMNRKAIQLCVVLIGVLMIYGTAWSSQKVTYFHTDNVGSPIAATDESGAVVWREDYRPFGERLKKEAVSSDNETWYAGKRHDDYVKLTYSQARWYDPEVGRFMGIDPIEFQESSTMSFNRYIYANNNPYRYVDPDGKLNWPIFPGKWPINSDMNSFRKRSDGSVRKHKGTDQASAANTPLLAVAPGVVLSKYESGSFGNTLVIVHGVIPEGIHKGKILATLMAHLIKPAHVDVGAKVQEGSPVGFVGTTGSASKGNHIHFEAAVFDEAPKTYSDFINGNKIHPSSINDTGLAKLRWGKKGAEKIK